MTLKSFPAQVATYTAIIFAVMFWSGWHTQKTIYDRFVVHVEGNILDVSDTQRSLSFYRDVLDFSIAPARDNSPMTGVLLPDDSKIFLRSSPRSAAAAGRPSTLVVKVRNGFEKLQSSLVRRSGKPEYRNTRRNYLEEMDSGMISEIVERAWGQEFVACDPDGNRVIFFKANRRSGTRL